MATSQLKKQPLGKVVAEGRRPAPPKKNFNTCAACKNPIEPGFEMQCVECADDRLMCDGCHMTHMERKHELWKPVIKRRRSLK